LDKINSPGLDDYLGKIYKQAENVVDEHAEDTRIGRDVFSVAKVTCAQEDPQEDRYKNRQYYRYKNLQYHRH